MRKQQIKLTESKILEAINDVLTDYENGEDGLYGSAREAIKNNTGFERWFSTKALPAGIDKEEALNLYTNAKRDLESLQYTGSKYSTDKQDDGGIDKYVMDDSRFNLKENDMDTDLWGDFYNTNLVRSTGKKMFGTKQLDNWFRRHPEDLDRNLNTYRLGKPGSNAMAALGKYGEENAQYAQNMRPTIHGTVDTTGEDYDAFIDDIINETVNKFLSKH